MVFAAMPQSPGSHPGGITGFPSKRFPIRACLAQMEATVPFGSHASVAGHT